MIGGFDYGGFKKTPEDTVDAASSAYLAQIDDVSLCRDVSAGTTRMRAKRSKYLPKAAAEEQDDYNGRVNRSVFFNAFGRSTEGLTGLVYRENPQYADVPPAMEPDLENIDGNGTHIDIFAKNLFDDALSVGHSAIFVDVPAVEGQMSAGAERAAGIRPYWRHVKKEDIGSWRFVVDESGRHRLTQVVMYEPELEPKGDFQEEERKFYRVLRMVNNVVTYQIYEVKDRTSRPITGEIVMTNITDIPLVPIYAGPRLGVLASRPPLLDLAWTNVSHYQVRSDHLWSLHVASVPMMLFTGVTSDDTLKVGPNAAIKLPDTASTGQYIEHSGQALGATLEMQKVLVEEMAVLGLSMLQRRTNAAETAEAKRIDKAEQDSALSTASRSQEDALEVALRFHAEFMKLGDSGGEVTMNSDFEALVLDAADLKVYSDQVAMGQLSLDTMWQVMREGGKLPDDFDPEAEKVKIAEEGLIPMISEEP